MILYRCFAWNRRARAGELDAPLAYPRAFQGEGRHDNPDAYGCVYLADSAVSGVVEQLAPWRGQRLLPTMLVRRGLPLAIAQIHLDDASVVIDLDDPRRLTSEQLRPSEVATRHRELTQPQALRLYRRHEDSVALRWWSTYESLWANYTVFDRGAQRLDLADVRELGEDDADVGEAADILGLRQTDRQ